MAIKFTLASGHIIETDTPEEAKQIASALQLNHTSGASSTTPNNSQQVPSVEDFKTAFQNQELKAVLRFIANQGNSGTISKDDLEQNTGKKSLSGMGKLFVRLTSGVTLSSLIKKNSIKDVYEVDQSAYKNLVDAFN